MTGNYLQNPVSAGGLGSGDGGGGAGGEGSAEEGGPHRSPGPLAHSLRFLSSIVSHGCTGPDLPPPLSCPAPSPGKQPHLCNAPDSPSSLFGKEKGGPKGGQGAYWA